jgi:D-alanyl-D-alanine carboxypeptidase (penicillin-binding protein 5/6)
MKKFISMFLLVLFLIPGIVKASDTIKVNKEVGLASNAKSAILIEPTTGKIIFEKNSHEKLAPASMTKIMSMLLIMESLDKGIIKWDDKVTASANASGMGGSQILLETGEQMTVKDLFKGIAVASGNDAVVAMAEHIAGSEEEFVKMMNDKVRELGLKDTVFKNPHGLDTANHYSSAYDMAHIAKELVKYDEILNYTSIYEDYLRKGTDRELWLVNTNKLVKFNPIVDGLKTGYTKEAGYCLTATGKKDGMRLISVVMGEPDINTRSSETTELLNYGFSKYKAQNIIKN